MIGLVRVKRINVYWKVLIHHDYCQSYYRFDPFYAVSIGPGWLRLDVISLLLILQVNPELDCFK
jgi:hypothetical protein